MRDHMLGYVLPIPDPLRKPSTDYAEWLESQQLMGFDVTRQCWVTFDSKPINQESDRPCSSIWG